MALRRILMAVAGATAFSSLTIAQTTAPAYRDRSGQLRDVQGVMIVNADGSAATLTGGSGGGGDASAANQQTQIAAEQATRDRIGDLAAPATGSVNARLSTLAATLGAPMQQTGGTVGIAGVLPAFASPPTVNLGTIAGVATTARQDTAIASLSTIATNTTGAATAALQSAGNASLATIAANSAAQAVPYTWGPYTASLTAASQTIKFTVPGSASLIMRVSGTCIDTNPAAITFGNNPDTASTSLGAARLYKSGVGSLGRNSLMCNGAISGGYRLVTGGSVVSVTTSATFSGSVTILAFATQSADLVFVNGPVHNAEEEALRAGRAFIVSTSMQSVAAGNDLNATLSNPAGSGVNVFILQRMFECNQATATTPNEWATYANPTTVPTTTVAMVNRKPGDTTASVSTFRWSAATTPLAGGVQADSGPVATGGGTDPISTMTMLTPGVTVGVSITGSGGGLAAAARCKVSYLTYEEPIN